MRSSTSSWAPRCHRAFRGAVAVAACVAGFAVPPPACAQNEYPDRIIDAEIQAAVIDSVSRVLYEMYVYPDVAHEMEKYVRGRYAEGAYEGIASEVEFTQKLRADLYEICKDGHLNVRFAPDEVFAEEEKAPSEEDLKAEREEEAFENFGFLEVKRLWGNIGYLKLNGFYDAEEAGPTAAAAMGFLAHCGAVIVDLRQTLGGSPTMVQLLASYFFDRPVELSGIYFRPLDSTKQYWTYAYVPGPRLADADLYILTSRQTPSAAEQFVYDMKALKRATVVGDTTTGAAHPSMQYGIAELNVVISLPHARAVNPVTGTNWEGVGVAPDVVISPEEALDVAHVMALEGRIAKCADEGRKTKLIWAREWVDGRSHPAPLTVKELRTYAGSYGPRIFEVVDGRLEYHRGTNPPYALVPIGDDLFLMEGLYYMRFRFLRDDAGRVSEVVSVTERGPSSRYKRNS
jgi:hypothetical protein